jgi:hypothetical protein
MIVFGSFVTTKAEPNDVDVFLLMGTVLTFRGDWRNVGFRVSG